MKLTEKKAKDIISELANILNDHDQFDFINFFYNHTRYSSTKHIGDKRIPMQLADVYVTEDINVKDYLDFAKDDELIIVIHTSSFYFDYIGYKSWIENNALNEFTYYLENNDLVLEPIYKWAFRIRHAA